VPVGNPSIHVNPEKQKNFLFLAPALAELDYFCIGHMNGRAAAWTFSASRKPYRATELAGDFAKARAPRQASPRMLRKGW